MRREGGLLIRGKGTGVLIRGRKDEREERAEREGKGIPPKV